MKALIEWLKMKIRGEVRINPSASHGRIYLRKEASTDTGTVVNAHHSVSTEIKVIRNNETNNG